MHITVISEALTAAKKFTTHFRHSALATAALRTQETISVEPKKLQQPCITRWNSTLYMIQSLLHNRCPIAAVLADVSVTKPISALRVISSTLGYSGGFVEGVGAFRGCYSVP